MSSKCLLFKCYNYSIQRENTDHKMFFENGDKIGYDYCMNNYRINAYIEILIR